MKTTDDALLDGKVALRQPADGYRAAMDPVFLAASIEANANQRALDLGCGVGAAMLCLATRVPDIHVDGLELQPELVALAQQNIQSNAFEHRVRVFTGDILSPPHTLSPELGQYHHVFANPPYMDQGRGNPPPNAIKSIAHVEGNAPLSAWVETALSFCRPKGTVTFIYRADRLAELLSQLDGPAGEISVFPLWPKAQANAKRVIVRARKGLKTPLQLNCGLVLHEGDGAYTETAQSVLKGCSLKITV